MTILGSEELSLATSRDTAIDRQHGAGNPRRLIRSQKQDRLSNISRLTITP
jgi:hypothetical protein